MANIRNLVEIPCWVYGDGKRSYYGEAQDTQGFWHKFGPDHASMEALGVDFWKDCKYGRTPKAEHITGCATCPCWDSCPLNKNRKK